MKAYMQLKALFRQNLLLIKNIFSILILISGQTNSLIAQIRCEDHNFGIRMRTEQETVK
jgi:hypothetical protein